ncbi:MAG: hypothetical protein ACR2P5_04690 [Gammaproteobacteria bacterium]
MSDQSEGSPCAAFQWITRKEIRQCHNIKEIPVGSLLALLAIAKNAGTQFPKASRPFITRVAKAFTVLLVVIVEMTTPQTSNRMPLMRLFIAGPGDQFEGSLCAAFPWITEKEEMMQKSFEALAKRSEHAFASFVQVIMDLGEVDHAAAVKVANFYIANKLVKDDRFVGGTINVKHGAYLDADVIARAAMMADN